MTLMKFASKSQVLTILSLILLSQIISASIITSHAYTECEGIERDDEVKLDYIGTLQSDGSVFDSTEDGDPAVFVIAPDRLIEGFYEGMLGLFVGDAKKITVPPSLGYTDPNHELFGETLIFDVHILEIVSGERECDPDTGSAFGNFLWKAFLFVAGGGALVVLGIGAYMGLQNRVIVKDCVHCKQSGRNRKSEGVCGKCGQPSCRPSFARGCVNCKSNTFIPHKSKN